ncbi:MAG: hypothetical protein NZ518_12190, partial [Dehalococcoidia bacterium]|nr:hypothetical protein [Dehalococcoidia bacterium]
PFPTGVQRVASALERVWAGLLRQPPADRRLFQLRIPFVDYARGDGVAIGEGGRPWTCVVISADTPWVRQYRGLWGVYVRDVFAGENAPAGPMYNRDGSVRRSWRDPIGWAGLDKVPTPAEEGHELARARAAVEERQRELRQAIAAADDSLQRLGATLRAINGHPHLRARADAIAQTIAATSAEAARLRHERATNDAILQAMDQRAARLNTDVIDDPRSHIRKLALPATEPDLRLARLVEIWGAVSISLLAVLVVALVIVDRNLAVVGAPALLGAFIVIEAIFRRQVARLIEIVTVSLAIVAAGVLITQLFWQLVVALIVLAAVFVVWENVQELRG